MNKKARELLCRYLKLLGIGLAGAFITLLVVGVYALNQKPDLKVWHTARLDEEFTVKSDVSTFSEYLALEDRLFTQLGEKVFDEIEPEDEQVINRYFHGFLFDSEKEVPNWNRSFELPPNPGAGPPSLGVLLIHGLSDSPYSLRKVGQELQSRGAHVVGLRVPGHGTAPSGLTRVKWQDMAAAVEIAMKHLQKKVGKKPLYVVGYSNGGALAVRYALSSLEIEELPRLEGIALISPEIGITPAAAFAVWQGRIGGLLGLSKLKWTDVIPEYDPYKYNSFPVNAGDLAHRLTKINRESMGKLGAADKLEDFPTVLAFQSVVDATVKAPALVKDLFFHLPDRGHELVLFGLNKKAGFEPLYHANPAEQLVTLLAQPKRSFTLTLLSSQTDTDNKVTLRKWAVGESNAVEEETEMRWPERVYSLSHVALPFSEEDPVYGMKKDSGVSLGHLDLRGEKGVLKISGNNMMRLRWNPFYPYLESRILGHFGL
ncbi:MAG: alpha/beta fold hydrolase [Verrucomicrobiales bacterium]|nr:alpha/beta fold hydrolase [Verrucomicrobiales bacterium]